MDMAEAFRTVVNWLWIVLTAAFAFMWARISKTEDKVSAIQIVLARQMTREEMTTMLGTVQHDVTALAASMGTFRHQISTTMAIQNANLALIGGKLDLKLLSAKDVVSPGVAE